MVIAAEDNDDFLVLVPLRGGQPIFCPSNQKAWIPLRRKRDTIVGRLEFLSCLYAACGCHPNIYSTKEKCIECQQVNQWAPSALSRQMLRISKGNVLSIRGTHAAVVIGSHRGTRRHSAANAISFFDEDAHAAKHPGEWRGKKIAFPGMLICLRELEGEGQLEFQVIQARLEPLSDLLRQSAPSRIFPSRSGDRAQCEDPPAIQGGALENPNSQIAIWFCPLGQDLPRQRIQILSEQVRARGAEVVTDYRQATHLVISEVVASLETLANALECSVEALRQHLDTNKVQCALPKWLQVCSDEMLLHMPARLNSWLGYMPNKRKGDEPNQQLSKRVRRNRSLVERPNSKLAECFRKLSKSYQSSPVFPEDVWKAYHFHKIAGRLLSLDFDVVSETNFTMKCLKEIPGISNSTIAMIVEYFRTGTIGRLDRLQRDPMRIAMKNIMGIWGIGRATALDLVQWGYHSIEQVRSGIISGRLRLTRNQLVGVECYEDILEEISRDEVECIGDIVINTFQSLCNSSAEVTIMGSYRRGKATSGDVDVLITLEEYRHSVAHSALQELVDLLWNKGHVAFHLTYLSGMKTGVFYSSESGSQEPTKPVEFALPIVRPRRDSIARKLKSLSYMGVFFSPKIPGKRRRVDLKIYPYAQKAFACLYFTGSAQFNRSMRLWAKQQFSLRLTDRGLFDIVTGKQLTEASDEEEVFKQLNLCYKAPPDRSFFDDVVPLTSSS